MTESFFSESFFPDHSKRAEVIPIFKKDIKKDSKNLKENYRPVSILSFFFFFLLHFFITFLPVPLVTENYLLFRTPQF